MTSMISKVKCSKLRLLRTTKVSEMLRSMKEEMLMSNFSRILRMKLETNSTPTKNTWTMTEQWKTKTSSIRSLTPDS